MKKASTSTKRKNARTGKKWAVISKTLPIKKKGAQQSRKRTAAAASAVARKKGTTTAPSSKRRATNKTATAKRASKRPSPKTQVYALQLQGGYVYVGKTGRSVKERLQEHMGIRKHGKMSLPGAAFTKIHRPTGKLLKRLGNLEGDGDGPERDETLRQMYKRGAHMVRGWKYVRASALRREELEDIECNIRELLDLCRFGGVAVCVTLFHMGFTQISLRRRCGRKGHFAVQCTNSKDRNRKALGCCIAKLPSSSSS